MMTYKAYTRLIIVTFVLVPLVGGMVSLSYRLEPVSGDLTRIGWLSEHDYGWNGLEYAFDPPLSQRGSVDAAYDIVVIGDSFSNKEPFGSLWHNYLQRDTGLIVGVFHMENYGIEDLLDNPVYRAHPPKLVIYQSVERFLKLRFEGAAPEACEQTLLPQASPPLTVKATAVEPQSFRRDGKVALDIGYGLKFLWRQFVPNNKVIRLRVGRKDLFSSGKPEELLVYRQETEKAKWTGKEMDDLRCKMMSMQRRVQANNFTKFLIMIAPDKLTVYAPYLVEAKWQDTRLYQGLMEDPELNILPLLQEFHDSVEAGVSDLYLPNDTHWSSEGNRLVSQAITDYLSSINELTE